MRFDVAGSSFRRSRAIRINAGCGDAVIGDFVRPAWGGKLGFVEGIKEGWATVLIVSSKWGHRELIEVRYLKRVSI